MRLPLLLVLYFFLHVQSPPAMPPAVSVPWQAEVTPGSPLKVSGVVSVRERLMGNQIESTWDQNIVATNVSGKPILLFIGDLEEEGPRSNGGSRLVQDQFFSNPIPPGNSFRLMAASLGRRTECCVNPLNPPREPHAGFHLLFVQYLDGSTVGDAAVAKETLEQRAAAVAGLQSLSRVYAEKGEAAFRAQLEDSAHQAQLTMLLGLQITEKTRGTVAAIAQLKEMLAVAENRKALTTVRAAK